MPRPRKFKAAPRNWTPRQKLAHRRNWCYYVTGQMEGQLAILRRFGVSEPSLDTFSRALRSLRYAIDARYYAAKDEIESPEAARVARRVRLRRVA